MDFNKIVIADPITSEPKSYSTVSITLEGVSLNDTPVVVEAMPLIGKEWEEQREIWESRWAETQADIDRQIPDSAMKEHLKRRETSNIELMARSIVSWNLRDAAQEPVECSLNNRIDFLRNPNIRYIYVQAIREKTLEVGNDSKTSSSGQDSSDTSKGSPPSKK